MQHTSFEIMLLVAALGLSGVLGGVLAGLLGVGGGIIIVPVLYTALEATGTDPSAAIKVAIGTSLATIVLTSASSARSHYKRKSIDISLVKKWLFPIFGGVILGTLIAGDTDGKILTSVFGIVAFLVALNMFIRQGTSPLLPDFPNPFFRTIIGSIIGLFSSLMGIGGGTLSVPILTAFGYEIKRAVGTSAMIGLLISVPGAIGYVLNGLGTSGRPPLSLGNINFLAFALLVPLTTLFAPLGARIAHTISPNILQRLFGGFLLLTSVRMLWSVVA